MPLNLNFDSTGVVRIVRTAGRLCRLPGLCMPLLLAACSFPTLPDSRPTVQEVPFLGQQMTQEQISTRRAEVAASRATASASPFCMAMPPPCPRFGGWAWAASPRMAVRPADQALHLMML